MSKISGRMRSCCGTEFSWNDTWLISSDEKGIIDDFDTCNFYGVRVSLEVKSELVYRVQFYPLVIKSDWSHVRFFFVEMMFVYRLDS